MTVLHYSAFVKADGEGGNPAGVVLDASAMSDEDMQLIAADLGYSESAFITPEGDARYRVRYFSPLDEVDFCGHATVAAAVALADNVTGEANVVFTTNVGEIPVKITADGERWRAALESVRPDAAELPRMAELLAMLGWTEADLDRSLPAGVGYGGMWHPVLWAASRERLASLEYDFEGLKELMLDAGWATISLLYRESPDLIHSRNAFPIGGVVEDPATGAAAAALGGFLRARHLLPPDGRFTISQGEDLGQPCVLNVDASGNGGVKVSGIGQKLLS